MISKRSRYSDGIIRVAEDKVLVQRRFPYFAAKESFFIWRQGMRLDILAARIYGNPDEWWRILDLNPMIQSSSDLRPGMVVRIPDA